MGMVRHAILAVTAVLITGLVGVSTAAGPFDGGSQSGASEASAAVDDQDAAPPIDERDAGEDKTPFEPIRVRFRLVNGPLVGSI